MILFKLYIHCNSCISHASSVSNLELISVNLYHLVQDEYSKIMILCLAKTVGSCTFKSTLDFFLLWYTHCPCTPVISLLQFIMTRRQALYKF